MIVADTSVWIDYFKGQISPATDLLDEQLDTSLVVIGDLILLEILQGFKVDKDYKLAKAMLLLLEQRAFLGSELALIAAENYRQLRKKGITIRKTNDVIIASYCIEHNLPLLFSDRDFLPFVEHLDLRCALGN
ncbi:MAG TPA: VapC toxin family PIN domain ribonuclease [Oceanospirillaceae bacterium]|nr:VapC toxin family PIN domain ribonuclease [Oceanospirillaceae bacterium]